MEDEVDDGEDDEWAVEPIREDADECAGFWARANATCANLDCVSCFCVKLRIAMGLIVWPNVTYESIPMRE